MKALLLAVALLGCEPPMICEEPCQGQSSQAERGAGIVCSCEGAADRLPTWEPDGVVVLLRGPGVLMAEFGWTEDLEVCAAYRAWWAENAPLPCHQPGGGAKREQP